MVNGTLSPRQDIKSLATIPAQTVEPTRSLEFTTLRHPDRCSVLLNDSLAQTETASCDILMKV